MTATKMSWTATKKITFLSLVLGKIQDMQKSTARNRPEFICASIVNLQSALARQGLFRKASLPFKALFFFIHIHIWTMWVGINPKFCVHRLLISNLLWLGKDSSGKPPCLSRLYFLHSCWVSDNVSRNRHEIFSASITNLQSALAREGLLGKASLPFQPRILLISVTSRLLERWV